jgi:hypothetical protein
VDEGVITSQLWRVLLRAIVTDAALCTFRHEGQNRTFAASCTKVCYDEQSTISRDAECRNKVLVLIIVENRNGCTAVLHGDLAEILPPPVHRAENTARHSKSNEGIVKLTGGFLNRTKPYDKSQTIRCL